MKNGLILLIGIMVLLAGCTGEQNEETETVTPTGIINFAYNINPSSIAQGEASIITMSVSNYYEKALENIDVRFEPTFSGITFRIDGPTSIEPTGTGTWIVDMQSASGAVPKVYTFRPVICFDYSQDKRGYFRVAPNEPSTSEVDYSTSTVGPMVITFKNLAGINVKQDNAIDVDISYAYANTFQGLTNNTSLETQVISYGLIEVDSPDLRLRALQGSSRLTYVTPEQPYCRFLSSGLSQCIFPKEGTTVYANYVFGFRVNASETLASELETYFLNTINYTICLKPISDFTVTVVKAQ